MLEVSLQLRIRNEDIRIRSRLTDTATETDNLRWQFTLLIEEMADGAEEFSSGDRRKTQVDR